MQATVPEHAAPEHSARRRTSSHFRSRTDLHRSQNLLQPLKDFLAIHVLAAFGLDSSSRNLERKLIASPIFEDVIVLRRFLASPLTGKGFRGLQFHVADHQLRWL